MCYLRKVGDGIFIDSKCTGIQKIEYGYFVPEYPCGASFEAGMPGYHEDLAAFLDKWFPDSERWERTKGEKVKADMDVKKALAQFNEIVKEATETNINIEHVEASISCDKDFNLVSDENAPIRIHFLVRPGRDRFCS